MKERFQNPVVGDDIKLRLYTYNSNNRADVDYVEKVEIYFLDPYERDESNPDGRRLVSTNTSVAVEESGLYSVIVETENPTYTIGKYIDVWYFRVDDQNVSVENHFQIYSDLWFTTSTPIVYDFNFSFRPNRLMKGSKRYLVVEIVPNVPTHLEQMQYYENLAITAPVKISIQQHCGECVPCESDLQMYVDNELMELREKCHAYYFLDTSDMETGIYDVWFELGMGESVYISEKQQLQIV